MLRSQIGATGALASVELRDPVFISDLHLTEDRPRTLQRFLRLVEELRSQRRELVILGDLFEYWAGDEEVAEGVGGIVSGALRSLTKTGTPVYLMHGNRDVLLGDGFARATGAVFLADPCHTELGGVATLLAHGDAYCTLDTSYQAFRLVARSRFCQRLFLRGSLALRRALIGRVRRLSEAGKKRMAAQIMDVTPKAIDRALRSARVSRMIHGHTHRPAKHQWNLDHHSAERWVLSDWDFEGESPRGACLQVAGKELALIDLGP
jgi:UDP-2,3-diacylglucosamine hydrolase